MTDGDHAAAVASLFLGDAGKTLAVADALRGPGRVLESTVSGGSMGQTLPNLARIRIELETRPACDVGDVVAVMVGSKIVVHRVIRRGLRSPDRDYVVTRGDANVVPDRPFRRSLVLGRVTGVLRDGHWEGVDARPLLRPNARVVQALLSAAATALVDLNPALSDRFVTTMHKAHVTMRRDGPTPRWVRLALAADRAIVGLHRLETALLDRTLCVFVDPAERSSVTIDAYNRQRQYLPGSVPFDRGLFAWELAAVTAPPFPRSGHLLLGGAGGGRELDALCQMGYEVTAFEPASVLVEGARAVAARHRKATVIRASYQDLVHHTQGGVTPFAGVLDRRIDGVLLGLGSFTHLLGDQDRVALLQAIRSFAPTAPVLLSFNLRSPGATEGRRTRRARALLAGIGVRTDKIPDGLGFTTEYGFRYAFTLDELARLASSCGYAVASTSAQEFPHAVLVPE